MYYPRLIDSHLAEWASRPVRKPLLLRGARQVGKSSAVRHLGGGFASFVEVNFEKQPSIARLFQGDIDVRSIVPQIAALVGSRIEPGKTLLFLDEVQACPRAIMALRFFKEDMPELHVVAAGSLLEFALDELPTFGVGRIHSMFMYPMSFDEFLLAAGERMLLEARQRANDEAPLAGPLHDRLVDRLRTYMLIGGMPEVVARWVQTHDYIACQEAQDDIVLAYEDDFPKYRKRVDPALLRRTLRSVAVQATRKFVYSDVEGGYSVNEVKRALALLEKAGLAIPVTHTAANGLPLGSEADTNFRKMMLLDTGLMLRLLNMAGGDAATLSEHILAADAAELVNRGPMAEMLAGLEMLRYLTPNLRHELFYWLRRARNSQAEVDYVAAYNRRLVPIEVKSGTQGGMKSLWTFMRDKQLDLAVRCSLEGFGAYDYTDRTSADNDGAALRQPPTRRVLLCPLYAIAQLPSLLSRQSR